MSALSNLAHIAELEGTVRSTHAPKSGDAPIPTTHLPATHSVNVPLPQSTLQAPLLTIAISAFNPIIFALPSVSMPVPAPVYTALSPMAFPASSAHTPTHTAKHFPFQASQPHMSLSYQASLP
ncbi:hypothetical protein CRG98_043225 [Punica granatum]|uniref:Uncharacterized protein n=1 Tax=Punica granatum TaxID=22663 RepID=A0A2I0HXE6_PUNGR|nr:hypothetical protein CRG98_043225 [Punica granatum]